MLPGAAVSPLTFGIALFLLGLGEAANFPACIKTVAEWFPKKERALATGIFNSGSNLGRWPSPLWFPSLTHGSDGAALLSSPAPPVLSGSSSGSGSIANPPSIPAFRPKNWR